MMSRMIGAISALILATFGVLAGAIPAQAAAPKPEHKTVVTTVTDRPENGNHGVWATDKLTRTVELTGGPVYVVPAPALKADGTQQELCDSVAALGLRWSYTATVGDDGTFLTKAGSALSPNDGKPLMGGVSGTVKGSFTASFTAPAHWCTFKPGPLNGKTVKGADAPKTSEWVKSLFTDGFDGASINDDWSWTYKACSESWWDAKNARSNDGETDEAGDITGKACPPPSPSAGPVVQSPPGADGSGGSTSLPVTGDSGTQIVGIGAVLLAAGVGVLLLVRRRRRLRFEA